MKQYNPKHYPNLTTRSLARENAIAMDEQQDKHEPHGRRTNDGEAKTSEAPPVSASYPAQQTEGNEKAAVNHTKSRNVPRCRGRKRTDCLLLIFNALLALFTLLLALFTYLLWDSTKKEIQLVRDNFISDKRAWIPADIRIDGPLTWGSGGGNIPFKFTLRNTGHTPALNVTIEAKLFPSRAGLEPNPIKEQKKISDEARRHPPGRRGVTIFPGDTVPMNISFGVSREELEQMRAWWKKVDPTSEAWLTPVLVGCINYQLVFGGAYHQTGFILDVNRTDPSKGGLQAISPDKGDVPPELLRITFSVLGDGITN